KHFGIARISDITGIDNIGIPVYTSVRPLSESISIHSGKGLEKWGARAGAIIEAIEFAVALNPTGSFLWKRAYAFTPEDRLEIQDCFPVRASSVNDFSMLAWESMTNVQNGQAKLVPSDLVWMINRVKDQPLQHLQAGSNGLASGATIEDAILSG